VGKDKDNEKGNNDRNGKDDDGGQHRMEDNTDDARRDRPIPPTQPPSKHDR
jgi:hypothetical protein